MGVSHRDTTSQLDKRTTARGHLCTFSLSLSPSPSTLVASLRSASARIDILARPRTQAGQWHIGELLEVMCVPGRISSPRDIDPPYSISNLRCLPSKTDIYRISCTVERSSLELVRFETRLPAHFCYILRSPGLLRNRTLHRRLVPGSQVTAG